MYETNNNLVIFLIIFVWNFFSSKRNVHLEKMRKKSIKYGKAVVSSQSPNILE